MAGMSSGRSCRARRLDAHHVDAVIEVLAELAFGHQLGQVLVGGEDEARAQGDELVRAQAAELHLLQNAQQLDLGEEAEVADFVEEERAVGGLLEVAFAGADRTGEGAFLVAEELGFDQGLGNGAAGDGDERLLGARAEVVNGAGDQLLAGAAFAGDEHGGIEIGDAADELVNALHAGLEPMIRSQLPGSSIALLHRVSCCLRVEVSHARLSMVFRSRMEGGRRQ